MENKYYTPELNEFHIGFEYEMKSTFGDGTVKTLEQYNAAEWNKETYTLRSFPYVDRTMTGKNSQTLPPAIRVKYLDAEDIINEGFSEEYLPNVFHDDDLIKGYSLTQSDTVFYNVFLDTENSTVGVWKQVIYNEVSENWTAHILFNGVISNLSEFRRLMKQLNIK